MYANHCNLEFEGIVIYHVILSRATRGKVTPDQKNNESKQGREP